MNEIAVAVAENTQRDIFVAIAFLAVVFLVWFLVALLLEDVRMRKRSEFRPGPVRGFDVIPADPQVLSTAHSGNVSPEFQLRILRTCDEPADRKTTKLRWLLLALLVVTTLRLSARAYGPPNQNDQEPGSSGTSLTPTSTPEPSSAPTALGTPSVTGPLQAAPPIQFEAGPLRKLDVDGIASGIGLWQSNPVTGNNAGQAALSNGQVWIQKPTGWFQFYVQAGAYNILALGAPFLPTERAMSDLYGPVPVAYVKLVPAKNTSVFVGALPTLMGAEYTFDFENMNIQRGLLWNQENAVNRGIQLTQTMGRFTASISWNDGYYSNRYSWLSGSLTYTRGPHSLSFTAMGNLGQTAWQTLVTPVQNNGAMYALIYTYTKGRWIIQPYYQYSQVPTNPAVGVIHTGTTNGGALLLSRTFKRGFSLASRGEYITSNGSLSDNSVNLIYGPGSSAWSATLTPTFQQGRFFTRGDLSLVRANNISPGLAFGTSGSSRNQPRAVVEAGFLF